MIIYEAVAWVTKTYQTSAISELYYLSTIGVMEVLYNLTPLPIFIQRASKSISNRKGRFIGIDRYDFLWPILIYRP